MNIGMNKAEIVITFVKIIYFFVCLRYIDIYMLVTNIKKVIREKGVVL